MRDYSVRQRRRRLPPAAGDTEKLRARSKEKERKTLDLNGKSDCRQIADSLREAGAEAPDFDRTFCGERLVSDVAVEHVELPPSAEGGPLDDVTAPTPRRDRHQGGDRHGRGREGGALEVGALR